MSGQCVLPCFLLCLRNLGEWGQGLFFFINHPSDQIEVFDFGGGYVIRPKLFFPHPASG